MNKLNLLRQKLAKIAMESNQAQKTYDLSSKLFRDMSSANLNALDKQVIFLFRAMEEEYESRDEIEELWDEAYNAIKDAIKALEKFEMEVEKLI